MPIGNALTNDLTRAVPRCLANDYRLDIRVSPVITLSSPSLPIFIHSSIAITRFRPRLPTISDNNNNTIKRDSFEMSLKIRDPNWTRHLDTKCRYFGSFRRMNLDYRVIDHCSGGGGEFRGQLWGQKSIWHARVTSTRAVRTVYRFQS